VTLTSEKYSSLRAGMLLASCSVTSRARAGPAEEGAMTDHSATAVADRDTAATAITEPAPAPAPEPVPEVVVADLLVEEISIDGMCGVY
jgi:mycofactocin precursor